MVRTVSLLALPYFLSAMHIAQFDQLNQLHCVGGLMYCIEYLEANLDWLLQKLDELGPKYLVFDFPGKVHSVIQQIPSVHSKAAIFTPVSLHF